MPELPEVETVKRILEPQLKGRMVTEVTLNRPDIIAHPSPEAFRQVVSGARIKGMGRRGKFLLVLLENGCTVIVHLRMTGQLLVAPPDLPKEKHTHVIIGMDDGMELRYVDARRFGRFWLIGDGEQDTYSGISRLGPEPFDPDLNSAYLQQKLKNRRRSIKECLLDQSVVAGIGNIYGDEILFAAGIYPGCPACSLTGAQWDKLTAAIPEILKKGIEDNHMTAEEYLAGQGKEYRNESFFQVYGHGGDPCPRCKMPLEHMMLAGRSSCYCPRCQGEPV